MSCAVARGTASTTAEHTRGHVLVVMLAYLMLGSAMFLALLLQTAGVRAVPLAVAAAALATELALRDMGMVIQVLTPAALLIVMGGFAARSLGAAVRHGERRPFPVPVTD